MLIVAVAAGLVATVLAFAYINSAAKGDEPEQTVRLLFVTEDLPANHVLDPETDLRSGAVGLFTSAGLVRAAIKADEQEALRGRQINGPLPAGVPLLYSHLAPILDLDLSPGTRAMVINAAGVPAILVPGDHIDLIVSYQSRPEGESDPTQAGIDFGDPSAALSAMFAQATASTTDPTHWEAKQVLGNIRVIAIGDRFHLSRQQMSLGVGPGAGSGGEITIEVTSADALHLIQSTAGGQNPVTILIRPPQPWVPDDIDEGVVVEEES